MIKKFNSIFLLTSLSIFVIAILSVAAPLFVKDAYAASCGGVETTLLNCASSGGKEVNGVWSVLLAAINILTAGIVVVAIGAIVYAAILYTTASDNESQLTKSKDMMRNTILGLGTFAVMFSFIQFIVPGGAFGSGGPLLAATPSGGSGTWSSKGGGSGNTESSYASGDSASSGSIAVNPDLPAGSCYTVTRQPGRTTQGRMFHKHGRQTYAFENSPEGIRYAANHNYNSIDLDIRVTKDGVPVATHWQRPINLDNFYDPERRLDRGALVQKMTFAEVSRLKNRDGQSRIYSLESLAPILANQNVNLSLEIKTPLTIKRILPQIATMLNEAGVKAYVKGFMTEPGMNDAFIEARRLGFWTRGVNNGQPWKSPNPGGRC